MVEHITARNRAEHLALLRGMHRDRKRIFVDWLGWDVPHTQDSEADSFDDDNAEYLVLTAQDGSHLGSVRLLPSEGPHLLRDVFPELCEVLVPVGPRIREITRLCVSPDCPPARRQEVRRRLLTALVDYALLTGIDSYTLITDLAFLVRVAAVGWRCEMLGHPQVAGSGEIGALRVHIDGNTIAELRRTGVYLPSPVRLASVGVAA